MDQKARARTSKKALITGRKRKALPTDLPVVDDLTVAILTGGRPELLTKTLESLVACGGARLRKWSIVALVNGADEASIRLLHGHFKGLPGLVVNAVPGAIRKIGPALSELMQIAQAVGRRFTLHLEDDWRCWCSPNIWLDRAAYVLDHDRNVGQVRLRSEREKVMSINMATGRRIRWSYASDHAYSPNAHLTFNPNLMRTEDLDKIYPCEGEIDAQAKFETLPNRSVVQILPGAFQHLGAHSLRRSLGRGHA